MPNGYTINISGIEETCAALDQLPKGIVVGGYAKALRKGISVIESAIEAKTPIQLRNSGGDLVVEGGELKAAIKSTVDVDPGGKGGDAGITFGNQTHIANFVEYGHRMVGHKPGKKQVGQVPAHPFIRPAFDATAEKAIDVFAESLAETVENGDIGKVTFELPVPKIA